MRYCGWCGMEFGVLRHLFLRGDFCSRKCFEGYKREETLRLRWEAQHGDMQPTVESPPTAASKDDARAAIWSGILHAAKYLGKRDLLLSKRRRPPLVLLQEGEGVPVYFLNAGLVDFRLAQLIGPGHRMYGLEIPWPAPWRGAAAKNDCAQLPTMEQFIAPYVAAIREHAGSAPCILAGYSFAGLMAFEAAHQIRQQGGKVETLILLDAAAQYPTEYELAWWRLRKLWKPSPNKRSREKPQSFVRRLMSSGEVLMWILFMQLRDVAKFLIATVLRDPGQLTAKTDEMGIPLHWRLVERLYANMLVHYTIRPVDCRGILFRPPPDEDNSGFRMLGDNLGWDDAFTGGLEVIEVTGTHRTMMDQEENTRVLARALNEVLERPRYRGAGAKLQPRRARPRRHDVAHPRPIVANDANKKRR